MSDLQQQFFEKQKRVNPAKKENSLSAYFCRYFCYFRPFFAAFDFRGNCHKAGMDGFVAYFASSPSRIILCDLWR